MASSGDPIQFIFLPSLTFEEIPSQISKHKPDILHISAHGEDGSLQIAHGGEQQVHLTSEMLIRFVGVDKMLNALDTITNGRGSNMFLFTDQGKLATSNPLELLWMSGKREAVRLVD